MVGVEKIVYVDFTRGIHVGKKRWENMVGEVYYFENLVEELQAELRGLPDGEQRYGTEGDIGTVRLDDENPGYIFYEPSPSAKFKPFPLVRINQREQSYAPMWYNPNLRRDLYEEKKILPVELMDDIEQVLGARGFTRTPLKPKPLGKVIKMADYTNKQLHAGA